VHSPMCQIAWTETARGAERFAFQHDFPIELRFGLHIEPALWTSAELVTAHLVFQVFHRHLSGEVLRYHRFESFDRADLLGAEVPDLWAGMALGQAGQVTQSGTLAFSGVLEFRPYVWFERTGPGSLPGEFAVAPEPHSFLMEIGPDGDGFDHPSEHFIGGPGRPA
jgi:hypothetical protein